MKIRVNLLGMALTVKMMKKDNEVILVEDTEFGIRYLATLFVTFDGNIGELNTFDPLSKKVAEKLKTYGMLKEIKPKNPYGIYPWYHLVSN